MATSVSDDPFSTKPTEIKVSPQNQIGGPMGILDEWGGELIRTPQQIASDGGSFVNEGLSSIMDLIREDIAGQSIESHPGVMPAIGSLENFQTPNPEALEQAKIQNEQENYLRNYNVIAEATNVAKNYQAILNAKEQARMDIAGMSDQQFAKEAGYKNENFTGRFLRTIRNFFDVFTGRMAKLEEKKRESLPVSIIQGRLNAKDYFIQANMAGERQGGQHVFNAAG